MKPQINLKRKILPKKAKLSGRVHLRCHPKSWMDETLTQVWLRTVWCQRHSIKRKMLVLDTFRCYRMPKMKEILEKSRTDLVIIPGHMTSHLQIMDVCCNKSFKQHMKAKCNKQMLLGKQKFISSSVETERRWTQTSSLGGSKKPGRLLTQPSSLRVLKGTA